MRRTGLGESYQSGRIGNVFLIRIQVKLGKIPNYHFALQSHMCPPCGFTYNQIVRVEVLGVDMETVLKPKIFLQLFRALEQLPMAR